MKLPLLRLPGRPEGAASAAPRGDVRLACGPRARAFSVLELMMAVGLMGVIIFALYGMFHYTQRALRSNVAQVDVMEGGRAAMDMLARELAQMTPCNVQRGTNFLAMLSGYAPVIQPLVGEGAYRTNLLQECFVLTRLNQEYSGTLYRVLYASNGVGTLSRFTTNWPVPNLSSNNLVGLVLAQPATNFVRVADGVIHFRARPYDADGWLMDWATTNRYTNWLIYTNLYLGTNLFLTKDRRVPAETTCAFLSNLVPACVELEFGVLEPHTLEQFRSFPQGSLMASNFLARHVGQVHLFRQRIPIPQSPPTRILYP